MCVFIYTFLYMYIYVYRVNPIEGFIYLSTYLYCIRFDLDGLRLFAESPGFRSVRVNPETRRLGLTRMYASWVIIGVTQFTLLVITSSTTWCVYIHVTYNVSLLICV